MTKEREESRLGKARNNLLDGLAQGEKGLMVFSLVRERLLGVKISMEWGNPVKMGKEVFH